jgi:hypothetical protein
MFREIPVTITAFVDGHQPGWVAFQVVDSTGVCHEFIEKTPVVSAVVLDQNSDYPCRGLLRCRVIDEWTDERGRALIKISSREPDGVESRAGVSEFIVFRWND